MKELPDKPMTVGKSLDFIVEVADMPVVGDMNSKEFLTAKELTAEDWQKIYGAYYETYPEIRSRTRDAIYILVTIAIMAAALNWSPWWALALIPVWFKAALPHGQSEGYGMGYGDGYDEGFCKALGVSAEQAAQIQKDDIEAEPWRIAQKAFHKGKAAG